jgi:hypothetical protein
MRNLAPLVLLLAFLVGCSTTTGNVQIDAEGSVNSAMIDWTVHVVISDPPEAQQNKVKAAYEKYNAAKKDAQKLGNNQAAYDRAAATKWEAAKELTALIKSYNPTR